MSKLLSSISGTLIKDLDPRSIALWRIITGLALIYDLIFYKIAVLEKYYLDSALRPESFLQSYFGNGFGLIERLGDTGFTLFLYATLFFAICFTLGIFDKYVKPVLFVFYSLILINSLYLLTGFHFMILVSVYWSIFIPTSGTWSVTKNTQNTYHPLAIYGLYLQIAFIYLTGALTKNSEIWMDGRAIELVVQDEYFASGLGFALRDFPNLSKFLTYFSLVWEFLIPVFILIPFKKYYRWIASVMIIFLHLGILLIAQVGPFLIMGIAFGMAMLPRQFWQYFNFKKTEILTAATPASSKKKNSQLKLFVLIVSIAIMVKGNLRYWYMDSYMSPVLQSIPAGESLFMKRWIPSYFLYGYNDQPWVFFQMSGPTDLGLFVILEERQGENYSLNGNKIKKDKKDAFIINPSDFKNGFDHQVEQSDFIYLTTIKDVYEQFPAVTFEELLRSYDEQINFEKDHPAEKLVLFYLSKTAHWDGERYDYVYSLKFVQEYQVN